MFGAAQPGLLPSSSCLNQKIDPHGTPHVGTWWFTYRRAARDSTRGTEAAYWLLPCTKPVKSWESRDERCWLRSWRSSCLRMSWASAWAPLVHGTCRGSGRLGGQGRRPRGRWVWPQTRASIGESFPFRSSSAPARAWRAVLRFALHAAGLAEHSAGRTIFKWAARPSWVSPFIREAERHGLVLFGALPAARTPCTFTRVDRVRASTLYSQGVGGGPCLAFSFPRRNRALLHNTTCTRKCERFFSRARGEYQGKNLFTKSPSPPEAQPCPGPAECS